MAKGGMEIGDQHSGLRREDNRWIKQLPQHGQITYHLML